MQVLRGAALFDMMSSLCIVRDVCASCECFRTLAMRVAQLESESRREKEVCTSALLLARLPCTQVPLQERLADRADTSGLLKVCSTLFTEAIDDA